MMVLCDVPVIEICDPKIKKDVEKKGEIENDKIESVISNADDILDIPVNSKNKNRFDEKV